MKQYPVKSFLLLLFLSITAGTLLGQTEKFTYQQYIGSNGDTLNYRMLFPDYDTYDKNLIFILKGVTRANSIDDNGNELNNYIRAEGHLMGDAKVFGDEIQMLTVESIGEVHYLKVNINNLEAFGFDNPEMMRLYHYC